jgi:hypothetical protein
MDYYGGMGGMGDYGGDDGGEGEGASDEDMPPIPHDGDFK